MMATLLLMFIAYDFGYHRGCITVLGRNNGGDES